MRQKRVIIVVFLLLGIVTEIYSTDKNMIQLPRPSRDGDVSLEKALSMRRSVREYSDEPLKLAELAQLLWACQGVNSPHGFRTSPSAGALYPLEVYVVVKNVTELDAGIYHYQPGTAAENHSLMLVRQGDFITDLANAALGQDCIRNSAVSIVIGSVTVRTAVKYGDRSERYVHIETGHAAQNLCLQAAAFGLGAVTVGAFYDDRIKKVLESEADPVYIIPLGRRK